MVVPPPYVIHVVYFRSVIGTREIEREREKLCRLCPLSEWLKKGMRVRKRRRQVESLSYSGSAWLRRSGRNTRDRERGKEREYRQRGRVRMIVSEKGPIRPSQDRDRICPSRLIPTSRSKIWPCRLKPTKDQAFQQFTLIGNNVFWRSEHVSTKCSLRLVDGWY